MKIKLFSFVYLPRTWTSGIRDWLILILLCVLKSLNIPHGNVVQVCLIYVKPVKWVKYIKKLMFLSLPKLQNIFNLCTQIYGVHLSQLEQKDSSIIFILLMTLLIILGFFPLLQNLKLQLLLKILLPCCSVNIT